jgi:hypothetical protein
MVLALCAGLGAAELATTVVRRLPVRGHGELVSAAGGLAVVAVALVLASSSVAVGYPYDGYDRLSDWLRTTTEPGTRVAASEIGVVGWRSGREVVDYLGLLTDVSAGEVSRNDYASWLEREQPDLVVTHLPPFAVEVPAVQLPWFAAAYAPVGEIRTGPSASRVRVYERRRDVDEAKASDDLLLVTPYLEAGFEQAGIELDDADRAALNRVLQRYLGDPARQLQLESDDGVDLGALLDGAAADGDPAVVALAERVRAAGGLHHGLAPPIDAPAS